MRHSEFERAVRDEFGPRGETLIADLVLGGVGHQTAAQALAAGESPRKVWLALCAATDVAPSRRYGAGRVEPDKRSR